MALPSLRNRSRAGLAAGSRPRSAPAEQLINVNISLFGAKPLLLHCGMHGKTGVRQIFPPQNKNCRQRLKMREKMPLTKNDSLQKRYFVRCTK